MLEDMAGESEIVCMVTVRQNVIVDLKLFKLQQQAVGIYPLDFQKLYVVIPKQFFNQFSEVIAEYQIFYPEVSKSQRTLQKLFNKT